MLSLQFKIKAESTGYFSSENFLIAGVVVNKKIKKPQKAKENVPPSIARKPLHDQCKGAAQSPQATVQVCRDHQADGGSLADISLSSTRKRQVSHSNNRELTKEAPKPNSVPLAQEDKQETRLEVGVKVGISKRFSFEYQCINVFCLD